MISQIPIIVGVAMTEEREHIERGCGPSQQKLKPAQVARREQMTSIGMNI
jgi:hypothetical protein